MEEEQSFRTYYPIAKGRSYGGSVKNNPFLKNSKQFEIICAEVLEKSNSYTTDPEWHKDLRRAYQDIVEACRKIIANRNRIRNLPYIEAVPFAILEVLGSLINYYDHPGFYIAPDNYEWVNKIGYLNTPLSCWTRRLVYRIEVDLKKRGTPDQRWAFVVYFLEEDQWIAFSHAVSYNRLLILSPIYLVTN